MISTATLRLRILLTLLPVLILLAVLGSAGVLLLHRLGGNIDVILRENYESVVAMQDLKEALERIDSSFQFMLAAKGLSDRQEREGLEERAHKAFALNWQHYEIALRKEEQNTTIHPAEDQYVERLQNLTARYRSQGQAFFQQVEKGDMQHADYYGEGHLYDTFARIKQIASDILQLNQGEMKRASDSAKQTAASSTAWLSIGLGIAVCFAGLSAWYTIRSTLRPIQAVTDAALGISAGNLDQLVPVITRDELGQLAHAFNRMASHLRDYRQSQSAQLLRAQRTSQATIDSFPDPVMVINSEGEVEMANPAARRMLGVAPKQEGQPGSGIWNPPETLREPLAAAFKGQRDYLPEGFDQTILLGANDRERVVLPRILRMRDPEDHSLGAAVLLQDVTRLRLLDQMKSNLVATASHELKTPLTSIRLAVHLLLEEVVGTLNPKQMELVLDTRDSSERLLAVVNNLLDLARLEQGSQQLDFTTEAPGALLQAAAENIRSRAEDKGIEIVLNVTPGLPPVSADNDRFAHALQNLLDNAIAYTDRGGRIFLSAEADGNAVILSVTDTGNGISAEHLPHVFEKFFRVPGQSRGSGTGLGLAIVHEIVMAHGGTISCESQVGTGTSFRIRLPVTTGDSTGGYAFSRTDGAVQRPR